MNVRIRPEEPSGDGLSGPGKFALVLFQRGSSETLELSSRLSHTRASFERPGHKCNITHPQTELQTDFAREKVGGEGESGVRSIFLLSILRFFIGFIWIVCFVCGDCALVGLGLFAPSKMATKWHISSQLWTSWPASSASSKRLKQRWSSQHFCYLFVLSYFVLFCFLNFAFSLSSSCEPVVVCAVACSFPRVGKVDFAPARMWRIGVEPV